MTHDTGVNWTPKPPESLKLGLFGVGTALASTVDTLNTHAAPTGIQTEDVMSKKTLLCLAALSLLAECAASNTRPRGNGVLYDGVNTVVQAEAPAARSDEPKAG